MYLNAHRVHEFEIPLPIHRRSPSRPLAHRSVKRPFSAARSMCLDCRKMVPWVYRLLTPVHPVGLRAESLSAQPFAVAFSLSSPLETGAQSSQPPVGGYAPLRACQR